MIALNVQHVLHLSRRKEGYSFASTPQGWGESEKRRALNFIDLVDSDHRKDAVHLGYVPISDCQFFLFRRRIVEAMKETDTRAFWLTHGVAVERSEFLRSADADPFRVFDALQPISDDATLARYFDPETFQPHSQQLEIMGSRSEASSGPEARKLFKAALKAIHRNDEMTLLNIVGEHVAVTASMRELFIWLPEKERLACPFMTWVRFSKLLRELRCVGSPRKLETAPLLIFDTSTNGTDLPMQKLDQGADLYQRWIEETPPEMVTRYADRMKVIFASLQCPDDHHEAREVASATAVSIELDRFVQEQAMAVAGELIEQRAMRNVTGAFESPALGEIAWQIVSQSTTDFLAIALHGPKIQSLLARLCRQVLAEGRLKPAVVHALEPHVTAASELLPRLIVGRITRKDHSDRLAPVLSGLELHELKAMLRCLEDETLEQLARYSVLSKLDPEFAEAIVDRERRQREGIVGGMIGGIKRLFQRTDPVAQLREQQWANRQRLERLRQEPQGQGQRPRQTQGQQHRQQQVDRTRVPEPTADTREPASVQPDYSAAPAGAAAAPQPIPSSVVEPDVQPSIPPEPSITAAFSSKLITEKLEPSPPAIESVELHDAVIGPEGISTEQTAQPPEFLDEVTPAAGDQDQMEAPVPGIDVDPAQESPSEPLPLPLPFAPPPESSAQVFDRVQQTSTSPAQDPASVSKDEPDGAVDALNATHPGKGYKSRLPDAPRPNESGEVP